MSNYFFCSDLHFGHKNALTFTRDEAGTMLRPFSNVDEMDETIINNINSLVRDKDTLIILGDATMPKSAIHKLARLNGRKQLVLGNHDHQPSLYDGIFVKVMAYKEFDGCVLSHVPVHESQIGRWKRNVHGHLHSDHIMLNGHRDVRYYNVSIDSYACGVPGVLGYHSGMNFFPKSWDEIKQELYIHG